MEAKEQYQEMQEYKISIKKQMQGLWESVTQERQTIVDKLGKQIEKLLS
jgi:DNA anti-recombination protein RmuC